MSISFLRTYGLILPRVRHKVTGVNQLAVLSMSQPPEVQLDQSWVLSGHLTSPLWLLGLFKIALCAQLTEFTISTQRQMWANRITHTYTHRTYMYTYTLAQCDIRTYNKKEPGEDRNISSEFSSYSQFCLLSANGNTLQDSFLWKHIMKHTLLYWHFYPGVIL